MDLATLPAMILAEAPSTADWMQGYGAVGAFAFTGWLLWHELRVRREERRDREAAQARLVRILHIDHDAAEDQIGFRIWNGSGEPIHHIYLFGYAGGRHLGEDNDPVARTLGAGDEVTGWLKVEGKRDIEGNIFYIAPNGILMFDDAEGRTWIRPDGEQPRRWVGPAPLSYKSSWGLAAEYVATFRVVRWMSWLRTNLDVSMRSAFEKRIRAKEARDSRRDYE